MGQLWSVAIYTDPSMGRKVACYCQADTVLTQLGCHSVAGSLGGTNLAEPTAGHLDAVL